MKRLIILSYAVLLLAGCTLQEEYDFSSSSEAEPYTWEEGDSLEDFYAAGIDERGNYTGRMLLTNRAGTIEPQPDKAAFPELDFPGNTSYQFPNGEGGWHLSEARLSYYNEEIVVSGYLSLPQSNGTLDDANPLGWADYVFVPDDASEELLPMPANLAVQLRPEDRLIYLNDRSLNKDIKRMLKGEYEISTYNTLPAPEKIYVRVIFHSYSVNMPINWEDGGGIFRASTYNIELLDTIALRDHRSDERIILRTGEWTEFTDIETYWSSYTLLWARGAESEEGLNTLTQIEAGLAGPALKMKGKLVGREWEDGATYLIFLPDEDITELYPQLDVFGEVSQEIRLPDPNDYYLHWRMSDERPIYCTVELSDFTIQWSQGAPQVYYGDISEISTFETFSTVPIISADGALAPVDAKVGDEILGLQVTEISRTRRAHHIPGYAARYDMDVLDVAFEGEVTLTGTIGTMEMCESDAEDILFVPDAASMAMLPMPVENSGQMEIYLISPPDDIPVYSTVSITLKNYRCGLGYGVFGELAQAEVVSVRILPNSTISE